MVNRVAKIIIKDPSEQFLVLRRSEHPYFPHEADLPGGIIEPDETVLEGLGRELAEEIQFVPGNLGSAQQLYSGTDYSRGGIDYQLYELAVPSRPEITISWEHEAFAWVPAEVLLQYSRGALDSYMRMVTEMLEKR